MILYNFLTRKKEKFKPIRGKEVRIYDCGPTVYDFVHIGNLRTFIFEDVLRRSLEYGGYRVKQIQNITDIDDKIIKKAEETKSDYQTVGKKYSKLFFDDLKELNIEKADAYPRATQHISDMLKLIGKLVKKGYAYQGEDGSVYFRIGKFKNYGKLSEIKKRELLAGARVSSDEYEKEEAQDFVLWKAKKPKEPSWESLYGEGRPGWHIECSAMSMKYLGEHFDIHAGAVDLLFPHHENEIAQSEAATGRKFVNFFLEGEHLLVNGQKMSKSLGNIYRLADIEERGVEPLAFRYLTLGSHYRAKMNFTWEALLAAGNALNNLRRSILRLAAEEALVRSEKPNAEEKRTISQYDKNFRAALDDDLGTPAALAVAWEAVANEHLSPKSRLNLILEFDRVFGLKLKETLAKSGKVPAAVSQLVVKREEARDHKQFIQADSLRKKIEQLGYTVEDTSRGPLVTKK
jgi:cysteinyl-tRNA synthetase